MMTIVTHVTLKEGTEPEWDAAMRERMQAARDQPGWSRAACMRSRIAASHSGSAPSLSVTCVTIVIMGTYSEGGSAPLPTDRADLTVRSGSGLPPERIARAKPALESARLASLAVQRGGHR